MLQLRPTRTYRTSIYERDSLPPPKLRAHAERADSLEYVAMPVDVLHGGVLGIRNGVARHACSARYVRADCEISSVSHQSHSQCTVG